jgi:purine-binding chemotaxis protein CheW
MTDDKRKPQLVVEQQFALHSYLDALLREVPETEPEPAPPAAPPPPRPVLRAVPAVAETAPAPPVPAPESAPVPEVQAGAPEWAAAPFQCLLFKVAGLSLAVPLAKLNGVIPWQEVTPMPNRSARFLGLLRHLERNVKVVDTARVVLPPDRVGGLSPAPERVGHILLMDEAQWGLACDSIGEVLTLGPDDVRWRSAQGKRPWLAGTVLAHLCALLDVDAFCRLLEAGAAGDA